MGLPVDGALMQFLLKYIHQRVDLGGCHERQKHCFAMAVRRAVQRLYAARTEQCLLQRLGSYVVSCEFFFIVELFRRRTACDAYRPAKEQPGLINVRGELTAAPRDKVIRMTAEFRTLIEAHVTF